MELLSGVAILVAAACLAFAVVLAARLRRAEEQLARMNPELGEDEIAARVEALVGKEMPASLEQAFSGHLRRLAEDVRRAVRREMDELLDRPDVHKKLEATIEAKLTNGAFATQLQHLLDARASARLPGPPAAAPRLPLPAPPEERGPRDGGRDGERGPEPAIASTAAKAWRAGPSAS